MVPWLLCALLGGWGLYLLGRLYCLHRAMEALAGQLTDWLDRDTNTLLTLSLSRDPYVRLSSTGNCGVCAGSGAGTRMETGSSRRR